MTAAGLAPWCSLVGATLPIHLAYWQRTLIGLVVLLAVVPALALALSHGTRLLRARARRAGGPTGAGPGGALQPVADLAKALQTEDLLAPTASRALADVAVVAALGGVFGALALVPLGPHQLMAAPGIGGALAIVLLVLAGLAALFADGAVRPERSLVGPLSAAVLLVVVGAAALVTAGGAAMGQVVRGQIGHGVFGYGRLGLPGVVLHPLGFVVWLGCASVLWRSGMFRPLDAASDPLARTAGIRRWIGSLTRSAGLLAASVLAATLFLGGWALPGHPTPSAAAVLGPLVLGAKSLLLAALVVTTEVAWPPLSERTRAVLLWRWFAPMALVDLGVTIFAKLVW